MERRYLQFKNDRTMDAGNPIDVTGKSERQVEQIERGMLMKCDTEAGWYVDDYRVEPATQPKDPTL